MSAAVSETGEMVAVRVDVDGSAELVALTRGGGPQVHRVLGCRCADVLRLASGLDMWIDDEGLMVAEPVINRVATRIAHAYGFTGQPYAGPVLFTSVEEEGETVGLVSGQVATLMATVHVGGVVVVDAAADADDEDVKVFTAS